MPRIDPLLTAMVSNRAYAVRLSDGDIAHLVRSGTEHPLTRQPLADGQLLVLLREMAPPHVVSALGGIEPVEFVYANAEGRFVTRVSRQNGTLKATVSANPAPTNGNAVSSGNGPVAVPAFPAAPAFTAPAAISVADPGPGGEIDGLLRQLVNDDGSDLHLRVGEPPLLRVHGSSSESRTGRS